MQKLKILNKKESEKIFIQIKEHYGISDLSFNYGMLKNKDGKIFLVSKDIDKIELSKLRINELGLYIAKLDNGIRLTIEGSQIFGRYATKNVYDVNEEDAYSWLKGNDIACSKEFNDFVIIKYQDNYLGAGRWKDKKILNYIPKERRIK